MLPEKLKEFGKTNGNSERGTRKNSRAQLGMREKLEMNSREKAWRAHL